MVKKMFAVLVVLTVSGKVFATGVDVILNDNLGAFTVRNSNSVEVAHIASDGGILAVSPETGAKLVWDPKSISFASGINNTVGGIFSIAMGANNLSSGTASVALGSNLISNKDGSVAMGDSNIASGPKAFAMGTGTTASGHASTAIGSQTTASGQGSFASGNLSTASGNSSIAMGYKATSSGNNSVAIGDRPTASGGDSTALGFATIASNDYSTAIGKMTVASGSCSIAMGESTSAEGSNSFAIGRNVTNNKVNSLMVGFSSSPTLYVDNNNVGIKTKNPSVTLQVGENADGTSATANAWNTFSSRRWKKNIKTLNNSLDKVSLLRGVSFDWNKSGKHDIGMIAEEVGKVFPELVDYEENGKDAKSLDYGRMTAVLVEAVKELRSENRELKDRIKALEEKIK